MIKQDFIISKANEVKSLTSIIDMILLGKRFNDYKENRMINNPIIKGFHPDPNILRVDENYYIVTSTFQWYPGVEIHTSENLKDWQLVGRPLGEDKYLNMTGEAPGCGVWAPQISYHEGLYYIVYSDCKTFGSVHNYLITSESIKGLWSDPIYLCSGAFDISLYHEGAKKYLLLCEHDGRKMANMANLVNGFPAMRSIKHLTKEVLRGNSSILIPFNGIALLEYDHLEKRTVGERKIIFKGTKLGATEGPNLYKKNGYYYLITAEGGTGYNHAVTLARSKSIKGPYVVHPNNPILTAPNKKYPLQRMGHGSLVETPEGDTYMSFLCSRPMKKHKGSILGRESALIKMFWKDDWLYADYDSIEIEKTGNEVIRDYTFEGPLHQDFQWLRCHSNYKTLQVTNKGLEITGKEWLDSRFEQGLTAVRMESHNFIAETRFSFIPSNEHHSAGIAAYYSTELYLYLSFENDGLIKLRKCVNGYESVIWSGASKGKDNDVRLVLDKCKIHFEIKEEGVYKMVHKPISALFLSDETSKPYGFTGTFIALCCQDLSGENNVATYDYLRIIEEA